MHLAKLILVALSGSGNRPSSPSRNRQTLHQPLYHRHRPLLLKPRLHPQRRHLLLAKSGDTMEGLAAVYSDKLNGRKTASGQAFRQSELTAAHPSLPFGTKVKVTNTKNNKSVVVRVNDRGPTQAGRVVDLSSAAAAKIGIGKKGTAPVKLEVVSEP